jgi:tRNA U34 2-thiouridine synthase MnmA/TrmU
VYVHIFANLNYMYLNQTPQQTVITFKKTCNYEKKLRTAKSVCNQLSIKHHLTITQTTMIHKRSEGL